MRIFAKNLYLMAKAIIAGASGLIGGQLLNVLLQSSVYKDITVLVRKELPLNDKRLKQVVINFEDLDAHTAEITGDALFCCLGSTKKKTPDRAVYWKIDHDYPLQLARMALSNGVKQYHLVSALGAGTSATNFYLKMKGETEKDISKIVLKCLHIYRASLLTGHRNEKRFAERFITALASVINPILIGSLRKYRSIPAKTVALAMYKQSLINQDGVFIHSSDQIKQIA
ncbi:MAG: NAD(P)H-binding protein [Candidatus Saccharimonadales bacterium]